GEGCRQHDQPGDYSGQRLALRRSIRTEPPDQPCNYGREDQAAQHGECKQQCWRSAKTRTPPFALKCYFHVHAFSPKRSDAHPTILTSLLYSQGCFTSEVKVQRRTVIGAPLAVIPSRIPGRPPFRSVYRQLKERRYTKSLSEASGDVIFGGLLLRVGEDGCGVVELDELARLAGARNVEEGGAVADACGLLH